MQAGNHGRLLGVVDMTVDQGKLLTASGRLEEIVPTPGSADPATAALVERYNAQVDIVLNQKAGTTEVDLIQEGVRQQETNLGNLVADIVRRTTGAQAAMVNGGSLRTGLAKGEITFRQIHAALPFNNYLVAVKMSGQLLLQTLEHGVSGVERGEGRFPQISGMTFTFDRLKPVGQRLSLPLLAENLLIRSRNILSPLLILWRLEGMVTPPLARRLKVLVITPKLAGPCAAAGWCTIIPASSCGMWCWMPWQKVRR